MKARGGPRGVWLLFLWIFGAALTAPPAGADRGSFPIVFSFALPNPYSSGLAFDGQHFWVSAGAQATGQCEFYLFDEYGALVDQGPQGGSASGWGYHDLTFDGSHIFGSCNLFLEAYDSNLSYVGYFVGCLDPHRPLAWDGTYFYATGFAADLYRLEWDGQWGATAAATPLGVQGSIRGLAYDATLGCLWATFDDPVDNLRQVCPGGGTFTTLPEYPHPRTCTMAATRFGDILAILMPGDPAQVVFYDVHGTTPMVRTVCPDGSGDFLTIQAALDIALDGNIIELCDAIFTGPGNRDLDYQGKSVIVRSQSGDPTLCTIDCQGSDAEPHRGFHFHSAEGTGAVLEGVTVTGGRQAAGAGGAVLCEGTAAPAFRNCRFQSNSALYGAAVACLGLAAPSFAACVFAANETCGPPGGGSGAALACAESSAPVLTTCWLADNSAYRGGGLFIEQQAAAWLTDCTLVANGGAHFGGGLALLGNGRVTLNGCTFVANGAGGVGGAIAAWSEGPVTIENCIIADGTGGGAFDGGNTVLRCCDIHGNSGGDWAGGIEDQLGLRGNFCADPKFCDPSLRDYQLWNSSPCAQVGCGLIGAWPIGCSDPQGVSAEDALVAGSGTIRVERMRPNPFAQQTQIAYRLPPSAGRRLVRLAIHDATGRLVRMLWAGTQGPGDHTLDWDGCDPQGRALPAGAYLCRVQAGAQVASRRVIFLGGR